MNKMTAISQRFELLSKQLDERMRRLFAAAEAIAAGHGGSSLVSRATGVSRQAIAAGIKELSTSDGDIAPVGRIRKAGGGRKRTVDTDPTLKSDLEALVEPVTRGDPESPLRWTIKSIRTLADELKAQGHQTSHRMVAELLDDLGYSLQANRKTREGTSHPDRNAQFEHINRTAAKHLKAGNPVISVDTKKKELVGDFKNAGCEWRPKGQPQEVQVHDFPIPELGRVAPYGVLDLAKNEAWVSVGTDHDTATFAVETIRRWWTFMGKTAYPNATQLLITADGGGSNGSRLKLWKVELQKFANELGFPIAVCHFPPGTSKWNKIEHRLFSYITLNWCGKPLVSHEVIVQLIRATKTKAGLKVNCELDDNHYPIGQKVSTKELNQIEITRNKFHGEWNYIIKPQINLH